MTKILVNLPPIHFHPILLIFIGIALLTGTFVELFIILSIVLIHELGHYSMAIFFKWRIRHVVLWIFGGKMDTDEHGNRPIYEEVLVTIAGPLQHVFIYLGIMLISMFEWLPPTIIELVLFYNMVILLFNLLPIWPLDGGKLVFLFLSLYMPFRKSYHAIIVFSMIISLTLLIVQLFFYSFTLTTFLIMLFLFMENRNEWKQRYFVFLRFLLQRYEGNTNVKGVRPLVVPYQLPLMDVLGLFQRDMRHSIYITSPSQKRLYLDETDCLHSYFSNKQYKKTIGEVASEI